jgi:hypothetical protein
MRRLSCILAASIAILMSGNAAGAPHFGKWKLNVAKSKVESWSPKSQVRTFEDWRRGLVHITIEGTDPEDKPTFGEFVARLDGRFYPYVIRGSQTAHTIALKRAGAGVWEFTVKSDGKVTYMGTYTLSADQKSFTLAYKMNPHGDPADTVLVFDKQ